MEGREIEGEVEEAGVIVAVVWKRARGVLKEEEGAEDEATSLKRKAEDLEKKE